MCPPSQCLSRYLISISYQHLDTTISPIKANTKQLSKLELNLFLCFHSRSLQFQYYFIFFTTDFSFQIPAPLPLKNNNTPLEMKSFKLISPYFSSTLQAHVPSHEALQASIASMNPKPPIELRAGAVSTKTAAEFQSSICRGGV